MHYTKSVVPSSNTYLVNGQGLKGSEMKRKHFLLCPGGYRGLGFALKGPISSRGPPTTGSFIPLSFIILEHPHLCRCHALLNYLDTACFLQVSSNLEAYFKPTAEL